MCKIVYIADIAYMVHGLQSIYKIRPQIPPPIHLLCIQAFNQMIPRSTQALVVLPPQQNILHHGPDKQEHDEVPEDDAVSGKVSGRVIAAVDVRGNDTVEVSPADDKSQCDPPFVHTC